VCLTASTTEQPPAPQHGVPPVRPSPTPRSPILPITPPGPLLFRPSPSKVSRRSRFLSHQPACLPKTLCSRLSRRFPPCLIAPQQMSLWARESNGLARRGAPPACPVQSARRPFSVVSLALMNRHAAPSASPHDRPMVFSTCFYNYGPPRLSHPFTERGYLPPPSFFSRPGLSRLSDLLRFVLPRRLPPFRHWFPHLILCPSPQRFPLDLRPESES